MGSRQYQINLRGTSETIFGGGTNYVSASPYSTNFVRRNVLRSSSSTAECVDAGVPARRVAP